MYVRLFLLLLSSFPVPSLLIKRLRVDYDKKSMLELASDLDDRCRVVQLDPDDRSSRSSQSHSTSMTIIIVIVLWYFSVIW